MVDIVEVKNKLGNGCTVPYVVWCDDGNTYVVKFPGNPQKEKALVNEFIASKLCDYLGLPIMEYNLINVKIENYNDEMIREIEPISGTAFGTIYDADLLTILNPGMIARTKNNYDAIKILIFDILIGNYDRNKGNLMINSISKKLIMIDHTHIFGLGTIWDEYQLPRLKTLKFDISSLNEFNYLNIINSVKYDSLFYEELNKFVLNVKNINIEYVKDIMNNIPADWNVSIKEKEMLLDYIMERFNRVDEVLELLDLKGGDSSED